jgi:oligopeptide transport system substrate-binding protein
MRRLLVIPLGLLALLVGVMVWSGGGVGTPAAFSFINRGDIKSLDVLRMTYLQDIRVGYATWEGLYALHPQTLDPVPGAAESVELSPDKTVYTFHLRPDGKWTNGEPVVAGDFVFAWRRMLEEVGDYAYLLHYIKGAAAYEKAFTDDPKTADFSTVGVATPDDRTLVVTLEHPVTFFLDLVAFPSFFPLHERSMEPFREQDPATGRTRYNTGFTRPPHLVSNGPYRLADWQFKRRIRLVASDHYWDRANVKLPVIDVLSFEDALSAYLAYDSGAVDWLSDFSGDVAAEARKRGRSDLHVFPAFGTYFYSINCQDNTPAGEPNPFRDVRVRRAFTMAIDKRPIVENITRLGELPADTYIPRGVFANYNSPTGIPFDPAQAKTLLAEAGYPGGRGFPRFSILFNSSASHSEIAQYIARQWRENLGVQPELDGQELKIFGERLRKKDYAVSRASWFGDYNDVSTFTDKYLSDAGNNDSAWKNPEYDRLCKEAAREGDPDKRLRLLERAEQILTDEAPIIPIYTYVNSMLWRDHVKGINTNARNMTVFKAIEVRK